MRVVGSPLLQAHLFQQGHTLFVNGGEDLFLVGLEVRALLGHEPLGQGHVFQGGVLGKEVEALENQAEVQALAADLLLLLGGGVGGVEERLPPDDDAAGVGGLQEVQAAQEGGLAAAGGADDGQDLALVQREVDVFQDLGGPEVFFNVLYV